MNEIKEIIILYLAFVIFFCGRIIGKRIDQEYREPEGRPPMVTIPARWKHIFSFRYSWGNEVVRAGVIAQILGYTFSGLEILLLAGALFERKGAMSLYIACGLLIIFFAVVVFAVMLPFSFCYNKNIQNTLDCDWITQMQEALTIYPKRKCRIVQVVDSKTCIIRLGNWGRRDFLARTTGMVVVGQKVYAVHSNEQGSPFWTVITH